MIIKSMSRKVPSFDQLIGYMDLGASSRDNNIYYNLYSRKPDGIEDEFRSNSEFLKKRKNGVYMYHEVISITRSQQINEQEQIQILRQVAYKYIQDRAGSNLVYGVLHDDKVDNLHYHLLISSNAVESEKKHRLSKTEFDSVKKNLELYVLDCHPELQQKKLISKDKSSAKNTDALSNKGAELKRRTGKTPQRDIVKDSLLNIFASASTREEFIELMELEHYQLYKRGKHWGILNESTNRKHRFATLGVAEEFQVLEARLAKQFDDQVTKTETQDHEKSEEQSKPNQRSEGEPEPGVKADAQVQDTVKETKEQVSESTNNTQQKTNQRAQQETKQKAPEENVTTRQEKQQESQQETEQHKQKPQEDFHEEPQSESIKKDENTIEEEIEKREADAKNFRKKRAQNKSNFKKKR